MEVYKITRLVKENEIDMLNHVNNVVYLQWVQDVAEEHWNYLTKDKEQLTDYIWVVIRHEIDYKNQAVLNDEITVKTWVGTTEGIKSERHVEFYKEEVLLAKAKTTWCLLDAKSHRPKRITEEIKKLLLP